MRKTPLTESLAAQKREIVAILDLTRLQGTLTGSLLQEARRQRRVLQERGVPARSAVLLSGARQPGGVVENPRVIVSGETSEHLAEQIRRQHLPRSEEEK